MDEHQRTRIVVVGNRENLDAVDHVSNWFPVESFEIFLRNTIESVLHIVAEVKPVAVVLVGIVEWDGDGDLLVKRLNKVPVPPAIIYVSLDGNVHSNIRSTSSEERYNLAEEGYACDAAVIIEIGSEGFMDLVQRIASS